MLIIVIWASLAYDQASFTKDLNQKKAYTWYNMHDHQLDAKIDRLMDLFIDAPVAILTDGYLDQ